MYEFDRQIILATDNIASALKDCMEAYDKFVLAAERAKRKLSAADTAVSGITESNCPDEDSASNLPKFKHDIHCRMDALIHRLEEYRPIIVLNNEFKSAIQQVESFSQGQFYREG